MIHGGIEGAVQSVAGFASLHCAITLLVALMVQYTLQSRVLHWIFWANFGITVVATLYFGWHYVADDVAGILIALIAFYVGGIASGQKFDRQGSVLAPDDHHLGRPGRAALTVSRAALTVPVEHPPELQPCSSSSRHAGDRRENCENCSFCDW